MKYSGESRRYVMIASKPPAEKWDPGRRTTYSNPIIVKNDKIMYRKLKKILIQHGENVSVSNSLIVNIINSYIEQGKKLKAVQKELDEKERVLARAKKLFEELL